MNFLTVEYKREYVKNGVCADGEFIDVQMGADYIAKNMRENLYDIFLGEPHHWLHRRGLCPGRCRRVLRSEPRYRPGHHRPGPGERAGRLYRRSPQAVPGHRRRGPRRQMPDITWRRSLRARSTPSKSRAYCGHPERVRKERNSSWLKASKLRAMTLKRSTSLSGAAPSPGFAADGVVSVTKNEDSITPARGRKGGRDLLRERQRERHHRYHPHVYVLQPVLSAGAGGEAAGHQRDDLPTSTTRTRSPSARTTAG